jgi:hypothetical protein
VAAVCVLCCVVLVLYSYAYTFVVIVQGSANEFPNEALKPPLTMLPAPLVPPVDVDVDDDGDPPLVPILLLLEPPPLPDPGPLLEEEDWDSPGPLDIDIIEPPGALNMLEITPPMLDMDDMVPPRPVLEVNELSGKPPAKVRLVIPNAAGAGA